MNDKKIGRYEIISHLGSGAMGVVYKAKDPMIDRILAIKVVKLDLLGDIEQADKNNVIDRFLQEARIAGALSHPNIVTVYDMGKHENQYYIAMEFVEGYELSKLIAAKKLKNPAALHIGRQICRGLQFAHQNKVIHRDVKPDNIMVQKNGSIKIMDFGIARLQTSAGFTMTGTLIGTPYYMSPEQITGEKIDQRVDVFATGVIIYEMLTGNKPFTGDNITSIAMKIVNETPSSIIEHNPEINPLLEKAVFKAIAKDPAKRHSSCAIFERALAQAMTGEAAPIEETPDTEAPTIVAMPTSIESRPKRQSTDRSMDFMNQADHFKETELGAQAISSGQDSIDTIELSEPEVEKTQMMQPSDPVPAPASPPPEKPQTTTTSSINKQKAEIERQKRLELAKFNKNIRTAELDPRLAERKSPFRFVLYFFVTLMFLAIILLSYMVITKKDLTAAIFPAFRTGRAIAIPPWQHNLPAGAIAYGLPAITSYSLNRLPGVEVVPQEKIRAVYQHQEKFANGVSLFNLQDFVKKTGASIVVMGNITRTVDKINFSIRIYDADKNILSDPELITVSTSNISQIPLKTITLLSSRLRLPYDQAQMELLKSLTISLEKSGKDELRLFSAAMEDFYQGNLYNSLSTLSAIQIYPGLGNIPGDYLEDLLQKLPETYLSDIDLAGLYLATDKKAEAEDLIEKNLAINNRDCKANLYKGISLLIKEDYVNAVESLINALKANAGNVLIHLKLADAYWGLKDFAQAQKYYESALWKDPLCIEAMDGLIKLEKSGIKTFNLPSIESLKKLPIESKFPFTNGDKAALYQTAGYIYSLNYAFYGTDEMFQAAHKADPKSGDIYVKWASVKIENGEPTKGLELLERAKELTPPNQQDKVLAAAGLSYYVQGDKEKAKESLTSAVQLNPGNSAALISLGNIALEENRPEDSKILFESALEVEPNDIEAKEGLAESYLITQNYDGASKLYNEIATERPKDANVAVKQAEARLGNDDGEGAAEAYQRAIRNNTQNPDAARKFADIVDEYELKNENFLQGAKQLRHVQVTRAFLKSKEELEQEIYNLAASFPELDSLGFGALPVQNISVLEQGYDFDKSYLWQIWNNVGIHGYDYKNVRSSFLKVWGWRYTVTTFPGIENLMDSHPYDTLDESIFGVSPQDAILLNLAQQLAVDGLVVYRIKELKREYISRPRVGIEVIMILGRSGKKFRNTIEVNLAKDFVEKRNMPFIYLISGLGFAFGMIMLERRVKGHGDIYVSIIRPEQFNKGHFVVKISKKTHVNLTSRKNFLATRAKSDVHESQKFKRKLRFNEKFEKVTVSRDVAFNDIKGGRYFVYLVGLVLDNDTDKIIGNYQMCKPVDVKKNFVNTVEFDLFPENSYVKVYVTENDNPALGAKVHVPEKSLQQFVKNGKDPNFILPVGYYTINIEYKNRRLTKQFKVDDPTQAYNIFVDFGRNSFHISTELMA